ncbi:unnamed protein product [Diatraea saccharalis]|uniref:C2H2-type domain-containing protein n=1 Tax=Diatraea saccharalis TaxID=40085 RepID=A0A9N9WFF6_9NEOP|nr:unnamed protein product [Diatraea saccharalis]
MFLKCIISNIFYLTGRKRVSTITLNRTKVIKINPKPEIELKRQGEIDKQLENLATILVHSNATPIRRKGSKGYACCFCQEEYFEAKDLKTHTLTAHEEIKSTFKKGFSMLDFVVKLDITSLTCNICDTNFDSIEDLVKHLTSRHNKPYHAKLKNYIIPFKFDKDIFECVECHQQYNNFKILLVHMNSHYRNHICNICDVGFVNRKVMLAHRSRHKKGVFVCPQCNKIFDAKVKQKEHERAVHVNFQKRYRCGFCNEKFTDYIKKNDHVVKMHGAKPLVLNCQACDKTFSNQRALNLHVKSYHLLETQMKKSELSSKKSKQKNANSFND